MIERDSYISPQLRPASRASCASSSAMIPRIESRLSQFCREQLGIDELQLSPFRDRTNASAQTNTPSNVRELLRLSRQNRMDLVTKCRGSGLPRELDVMSLTAAPALDPSPQSTDTFALTCSSRGVPSPNLHSHNADDVLLIPAGAHKHHGGSKMKHTNLHSKAPATPNSGGHLTFRDRQPTGRLTPLDTRRSGVTPTQQTLRSTPGSRQPSPFFHTVNQMSKDDITQLFEEMCGKIEAKATDEAEERAAQDHLANFANIVANVTRVPRPLYTLARRYVKDNVPTNAYRMHLRALWKFAAGRIILGQQKERAILARDAKRRFMELLKEKRLNDAREKKRRRGETAIELFAQIIPKRSSRVPPLTEQWYKEMRNRFREVCDNDKMELTIRDLSGKVDALILRKIDRDHSGTVSFFELLKIVYPSILVKDLQNMMRKWDIAEAEASVQLPTSALLSNESKRQIELIFRKCDATSKGVITKADMLTMFLPKDWDPDEQLWFEKYFSHSQAVVTLEEFTEMMKFCYPPFKHGGTGMKNDFGRDVVKNRGVPAEVLAAQERARIPD